MSDSKTILLKIIVVGDSGVGKTALLRRYVRNEFSASYSSTIGADFMTKTLEIDNKSIVLQIWDTAGQERFQSLGNAFYRGSDACILVYDITDKKSFNNIIQWRNDFIKYASPPSNHNNNNNNNTSNNNNNNNNENDDYLFLLIGNKSDLHDTRVVSHVNGKEIAREYSMDFFETSALSGTMVNEAITKLANRALTMNCAPYLAGKVDNKIINLDDTDGIITSGNGNGNENGSDTNDGSTCAC